MTDARWREVKALFQAAVERPPSERAVFIATAAGGDDGLRREIESLLDSDSAAPESLERLPVLNPALLADAMPAAWSGRTSPDGSLTPGEAIGCYEVIALLGAGGMGEVYRARDRKLNRDVALKVLPAHFALDRDRLRRLRREAHLLAVFNHPNIAAIYGLEESNGQVALVLELVEGPTLADVIASGSLPLDEALRIAVQVADALEAAHGKGVVHRDLKPANIKVTPSGVVKVLDFGLAMAAAEPSRMASMSAAGDGMPDGIAAGTAGYMSPEQAQGIAVDARADVWAFGCVLLEMLTGAKSSSIATLTMTGPGGLLEREPAWEELRRTPRRVTRVLRRCLETDPARRFASIAEVRSGLLQVLSQRSRAPWILVALAGVAIVAAGVSFAARRYQAPAIANRSAWVQLTNLDSVTQPALSPDGRALAFVRGAGTFTTSGDVYIKELPDGEPVALTHDGLLKMEPVFSPDGSRIAYTVADTRSWNTWVVGTGGGAPMLWRPNASGLTWLDADRLLFSEIQSGQRMAIVTADQLMRRHRDIYVPPLGAMAHRSYVSPDGKWVVIVEMDRQGVWLPCRIVAMDGRSPGHALEPRAARCTGAAWSRDGRWIYSSVNRGDGFHLWRQRFPGGVPQQLTFGPTEEEGIAVAPDGNSIITSVGLTQRSVWVHDRFGERQISLEGYAYWPLLSSDLKMICFRLAATSASGQTPTELWMADLTSGRRTRLLPGHLVTGYDLQQSRVVAAVLDSEGKSRLWLAWLDGREPPRPIPGVEGDNPRFGSRGEVYFRGVDAADRNTYFVFRTREDGTGREKVLRTTGSTIGSISPDGNWVTHTEMGRGTSVSSTTNATTEAAFRGVSRLRWSGDGKVAYLSVQEGDASAFGLGRTYAFPLRRGSLLPDFPPAGFATEAEAAAVPGVQVIPYGDLAPGPSTGVFAFSRTTTTRNLYRIPLD